MSANVNGSLSCSLMILFKFTGVHWNAGIGQKRSRLLHPHFPFLQVVNLVSANLLVYVAIFVQVDVGFYWNLGLCEFENNALTKFNIFVDCFSLFEMAIRFVTPCVLAAGS